LKNIIIYGVRGVRKKIETNLSDNYNIIGYSDSDIIYKDISEYEYKPFFLPQILCDQFFDYIIITIPDKEQSAKIVSKLVALGISQLKIIETCYIISSIYSFDIPLKNYIKLNQKFDGLFLGMSYSYNAFLTHFFTKRFYKLSYFGGDIYFHHKNIQHLVQNNINLLTNLKYIVFDLPYYAFNWDLSSAKRTIRWRFSLLEPFNDYHNYGKTNSEKWYIEEYKILKDMFHNITRLNFSSSSNNFEPRYFDDFQVKKDDFATLEHVWSSFKNETIAENITTLRNTLTLLKSVNPQIKFSFVTSPMYLEYLKEDFDKVNNMKNKFYDILSEHFREFNIETFDCFELFQDKSLFSDTHHLNALGGYEFSSYLNIEFQKCLY